MTLRWWSRKTLTEEERGRLRRFLLAAMKSDRTTASNWARMRQLLEPPFHHVVRSRDEWPTTNKVEANWVPLARVLVDSGFSSWKHLEIQLQALYDGLPSHNPILEVMSIGSIRMCVYRHLNFTELLGWMGSRDVRSLPQDHALDLLALLGTKRRWTLSQLLTSTTSDLANVSAILELESTYGSAINSDQYSFLLGQIIHRLCTWKNPSDLDVTHCISVIARLMKKADPVFATFWNTESSKKKHLTHKST